MILNMEFLTNLIRGGWFFNKASGRSTSEEEFLLCTKSEVSILSLKAKSATAKVADFAFILNFKLFYLLRNISYIQVFK